MNIEKYCKFLSLKDAFSASLFVSINIYISLSCCHEKTFQKSVTNGFVSSHAHFLQFNHVEHRAILWLFYREMKKNKTFNFVFSLILNCCRQFIQKLSSNALKSVQKLSKLFNLFFNLYFGLILSADPEQNFISKYIMFVKFCTVYWLWGSTVAVFTNAMTSWIVCISFNWN